MVSHKRYIALNINFDSLAECLKLCGVKVDHVSFVDPCFFAIMDRFLRIAKEYNAPLSIYTVGRELQAPHHSEQLKKWIEMGHEIGNHSWSHPQSLSNMPIDNIRDEVLQSHEIITEAIGKPPVGFIAPAWSTSSKLIKVLMELGYKYDTSLIPSWMQIVALAKLKTKLSSNGNYKEIPLFRKDLLGLLCGNTQPYLATPENPWKPNKKGLPVLPLPTGKFRVPVWHTMAYIFSQKFFKKLLKQSLQKCNAFYYLMHPLDLLDPSVDLAGLPKIISKVERINIPIKKKEAILRRSLDILAAEGKFVTMEKLYKNTFCGK